MHLPFLIVAALLAASTPAPSAALPVEGAVLPVEGYVESTASAAGVVRDASDSVTTFGIDGVTVREDGTALDGPDAAAADQLEAITARARDRGAHAELLVSNYSGRSGDFSPAIGHRLLGSAANRAAVAEQLATTAHDHGFDGVQVDLESLTGRDRSGLTAFVGALRDDVHRIVGADGTVSMAVMASTSVHGYRNTGYDVAALAPLLDRAVLMGYDQHGPWSGPGPIGSLRWETRAVRAITTAGMPTARLDLGVATYGYTWPEHGDGDQVTPARARHLAGSRARWSATTAEWRATLRSGTVVRWSDDRSFRARRSLAGRLHLHGLAVWSLNLDHGVG